MKDLLETIKAVVIIGGVLLLILYGLWVSRGDILDSGPSGGGGGDYCYDGPPGPFGGQC